MSTNQIFILNIIGKYSADFHTRENRCLNIINQHEYKDEKNES